MQSSIVYTARLPLPRAIGFNEGDQIVNRFRQKVIDDEKRIAEENGGEYEPGEFEVPPNLDYAEIDYKTGMLWTPICLFPFTEVYLPGTAPNRYCSYELHLMTYDYYDSLRQQQND